MRQHQANPYTSAHDMFNTSELISQGERTIFHNLRSILNFPNHEYHDDDRTFSQARFTQNSNPQTPMHFAHLQVQTGGVSQSLDEHDSQGETQPPRAEITSTLTAPRFLEDDSDPEDDVSALAAEEERTKAQSGSVGVGVLSPCTTDGESIATGDREGRRWSVCLHARPWERARVQPDPFPSQAQLSVMHEYISESCSSAGSFCEGRRRVVVVVQVNFLCLCLRKKCRTPPPQAYLQTLQDGFQDAAFGRGIGAGGSSGCWSEASSGDGIPKFKGGFGGGSLGGDSLAVRRRRGGEGQAVRKEVDDSSQLNGSANGCLLSSPSLLVQQMLAVELEEVDMDVEAEGEKQDWI
jgi:hypothetical protein